MIQISNAEVVGWEHAIRGARNPMNSWDKSDSCVDGINACNSNFFKCEFFDNKWEEQFIGDNDLSLMKKLVKAGTDHRKFMRMIVVYVDINAPLYWWKEFDTYKVGTVRNSCSTMHKIHSKGFTLADFSTEHLISEFSEDVYDSIGESILDYDDSLCNATSFDVLSMLIRLLNAYRAKFIETKDKKYWWQMIQLLPSSYNQKATVMLNYEVLLNMYMSRKSHKLDEWRKFCEWIETLPYFSDLIVDNNNI